MIKISKDDTSALFMLLIVFTVAMCTLKYFKIASEKYITKDVHADTQ